jgi:hypothetical protein
MPLQENEKGYLKVAAVAAVAFGIGWSVHDAHMAVGVPRDECQAYVEALQSQVGAWSDAVSFYRDGYSSDGFTGPEMEDRALKAARDADKSKCPLKQGRVSGPPGY